ncbi:MAG: glycosyltransferase family 1 protein [Candidatus Saccharimonadales bacterium]
MPKTIAIDARELRTSSGRYVERLLHYLQEIDHINKYFVLIKPSVMDSWQPSNPNFSAVACPHKEFSYGEQIGYYLQLKSLKADLVHFAFPQQPIHYRGASITTIHDLTTLRFNNPDKNKAVFKFKQLVYRHVIKLAAHKSAAVITPSNFVKDDVVQFSGVDSNKITVTYEAADAITDRADPLPELSDKPYIMYVGRPTPHKNLVRLIEAFRLLKGQHPELRLVLAGKKDANFSRVEETVHSKGIDNVIFTGFISEGQLRWLYENCAAYVFPSLSEGFGLPGLEAMVHGAPVVSSNATCLPEIYGQAAHYFDPLEVQGMADAINEVLTNKALRQQLITAGHLQADKYSWRRMAEQTLEIYNRVLGE